MKKEAALALFTLAGFTVSKFWELPNGYWPDAYVEERKQSPWWLMLTEMGPIEIGWRKRVISIHWDATPVRAKVTDDEVTKGEDMVHAWSTEKALEYLKALRALHTKGKAR